MHASIIGVHFRPGRAIPVLGVPVSELADAHVDLESLWGRAAAELRERLCKAATPEKRFAVLEEVLLGRLRQPPLWHGAIPVALDATILIVNGAAQGQAEDAAAREVCECVSSPWRVRPKKSRSRRQWCACIAVSHADSMRKASSCSSG